MTVFGKKRSVSTIRLSHAGLAVGGLVAAGLLLTSCDQTAPPTPRQQGAQPTTVAAHAPAAALGPVDSSAANGAPKAQQKLPTDVKKPSAPPLAAPDPNTPDRNTPVTATFRTDKTTVRAGDEFTVTVDVQIASGWHIYAIDRPTGPAIATELRLDLPKSLESVDKWKSPEPSLDDATPGEAVFVYDQPVAFQRHLRVSRGAAPGPIDLRCVLGYQACDRFSCRAPAELKLQSSIQIVP